MRKYYLFLNFIAVLIFIDIFKINHLWNENLHRRLMHHFQGSIYNPNKTPYINFLDKTISDNELTFINSIQNNKNDSIQNISPLGSKLFGGNYSTKNTLYYNDFSPEVQKRLDIIGNRIKPKLEKICEKKLELGDSNFRCVLLRYEGKDSQFSCHYDAEPHNCFRTLFLVNKKGSVPAFIYYDENGNKIKKNFKIGEGLFFKGTQTFHCVDKSKDPDMKRYMIGWQYSTDNKIKDHSLCSKLRDKSKLNIIKTILPYIIITILIGILFKYYLEFYLSKTQLVILILVSINISLVSLNNIFKNYKKIGTQVPVNITVLIKMLLICILSFGDLSLGLIFYNYLILTETILPRKWLVNSKTGLFIND